MCEQRPRVTGWFVDEDEQGRPLLLAMGRVVTGVAALEGHLKLELARFMSERAIAEGMANDEERRRKLDTELAGLDALTAGDLRRELQKFGLPSDLDERIDDAIKRRNRFVHHLMEDPVLLSAAVSGKGLEAAVAQLERLAIDSGELAVELHLFAVS